MAAVGGSGAAFGCPHEANIGRLAIDLAMPDTWCCQWVTRRATRFFTSIDACKNGGWTPYKATAFSIDEFVGERLKWVALLPFGGV
jgi:hypothetical protein